jgi:hypothetical protein
MQLSKQSIENLLDLVEIKLSCIQVLDRDDAREQKHLETCRNELLGIQEEVRTVGRRGRPRAANINDATISDAAMAVVTTH